MCWVPVGIAASRGLVCVENIPCSGRARLKRRSGSRPPSLSISRAGWGNQRSLHCRANKRWPKKKKKKKSSVESANNNNKKKSHGKLCVTRRRDPPSAADLWSVTELDHVFLHLQMEVGRQIRDTRFCFCFFTLFLTIFFPPNNPLLTSLRPMARGRDQVSRIALF